MPFNAAKARNISQTHIPRKSMTRQIENIINYFEDVERCLCLRKLEKWCLKQIVKAAKSGKTTAVIYWSSSQYYRLFKPGQLYPKPRTDYLHVQLITAAEIRTRLEQRDFTITQNNVTERRPLGFCSGKPGSAVDVFEWVITF